MEEKDVQRLLDMLYGLIDEAKSAAFSSDKCVISRDEALDLLDEIRAKLPLELKKAQELVRARDEYVSAAKKEVEKMLRQAELDAKVIVSESETLQMARQTRTAPRNCTRWPTPIPRTPCAVRKRPFRPLWTRSRNPACVSAPLLPKKCRPAAKSCAVM